MSPATACLLASIRNFGAPAKARPSDGAGIRRLSEIVRQQQASWIDQGCPDAPQEQPARVVVFTCGGGR